MSGPSLPPPLALESYFAEHQFSCRYLLSCSDVEPLRQQEVVDMADEETRALWDDLSLAYTQPQGHPVLRQEVAKLHGMSPEDVLVAIPQEALYVAIHCLVPYLTQRSGSENIHIVTCFPEYPVLYMNARNMQCDVDKWHARFTDNGWMFDIDDLKAKVKENTKLLIINFPHNPTGFYPSEELYRNIIDFCKSRKIFILSDEIYYLSNNDGKRPLPNACTLYDDCITLFGMSKTLAQPGLRIGWLMTRNHEVLKLMLHFKNYLSNCCPTQGEILSIITLRNIHKILKRNMDIVKSNLLLLNDFFAEYQDIFEWHRPIACTVTFVKVKGWLANLRKGGASGLCEELREEASLMLVPSTLFEVADDWVRLGFGRKDLPQVLQQFRHFLERHRPSCQ